MFIQLNLCEENHIYSVFSQQFLLTVNLCAKCLKTFLDVLF